MRLTIAYSKIKKRNLVLINNATYQRETLSERPIRQPLKVLGCSIHSEEGDLYREINTSFTEWHHRHSTTIQFQGHPAKCSGITVKLLCLFHQFLFVTKNFPRQPIIEVPNQYRIHMTSNYKIQAKTFTWPDMSFYAR